MTVIALPSSPVHPPAWLDRFYVYVGAHANPRRFENERDRAWQRTAMPLVSIAWIFAFHRIV
ncbi:MAG: hypothetical protein ABIW79_06835, partial [Gemmatimonas sp.]